MIMGVLLTLSSTQFCDVWKADNNSSPYRANTVALATYGYLNVNELK